MKPNSNIPVFTKYMSREHSLFYAGVWNEANRDLFSSIIPDTNIKNMLFVKNELGVIDIYYVISELDELAQKISVALNRDPKILDTIIAEFFHHWDFLFQYIEGKKQIQNLDELKSFREHWVAWYAPMAFLFVIPDNADVSEELRKRAFEVRAKTQEYSDSGDHIVTEYIEKNPVECAEFIPKSKQWVLMTLDRHSEVLSIEQFGELVSQRKIMIADDHAVDVSKDSNKQLKGLGASRGVVKGKVKLVLKKSDLALVENGDIMVTYATSPDYVSAMKKCSAIVTDEGGIVCHASIVARELGIPCVVGTRVGTRVLKDGDMVEVDAEKGIITVLQK